MAPPPEYDKEPKAPDKSVTTVTSEEIKVNSLVNDLPAFSDHKSTNSTSNNQSEFQNNKHVESLDDGQLRALLDEAIQYKCPKDREGKSSLFKELLEEVEHQDEVSEAASRGLLARGGGPHANSLQDLMAALKAEPRPVRLVAPQPSVSARAIHGGSLPSGVDTSSMLAEEPARGGYLATVRCVNPPPLAERRVSTGDDADIDLLTKRSKTMFPMYTARASLEIGSGAVGSPRAVTTTTSSNQVHPPPTLLCKRDVLLNALRPKPDENRKLKVLQEDSELKASKHKNRTDNKNIRNSKPRGRKDTHTSGVLPELRQGGETKNAAKQQFYNMVENWYKALDLDPKIYNNEDVGICNISTVDNKETPNPNIKGTAKMPQIDHNIVDKSFKVVLQPKSSVCGIVTRICDIPTDHRNINNISQIRRTEENNRVDKNRVFSNTVSKSYPKNIGDIYAKGVKTDSVVSSDSRAKNNEIAKTSDLVAETFGRRHKALQSEFENDKDSKNCDKNNYGRLATNIDIASASVNSQFNIKNSKDVDTNLEIFTNAIDSWYKGLSHYTNLDNSTLNSDSKFYRNETGSKTQELIDGNKFNSASCHNIEIKDIAIGNNSCYSYTPNLDSKVYRDTHQCDNSDMQQSINSNSIYKNIPTFKRMADESDIINYRKQVGKIKQATLSSTNPRNVKSMTIGKPEEINQNPTNMSETTKSKYHSKYKSNKEKELISKSVLKKEVIPSTNNLYNVKSVTTLNVIQSDRDNKPNSTSENNNKEKEIKQKAAPYITDKPMPSEVQLEKQVKSYTSPEIQPEIKTQSEIQKKNMIHETENTDEQIKKDNGNLIEMQDLSKTVSIELKCFSTENKKDKDVEQKTISFITDRTISEFQLENQVKSNICPEIQTEIQNIKSESKIQTKNMIHENECTAEQIKKDYENLFETQDLSKTASIENTCNPTGNKDVKDDSTEIQAKIKNIEPLSEIQINSIIHETKCAAEQKEDNENPFEIHNLSKTVSIEMKCFSTGDKKEKNVEQKTILYIKDKTMSSEVQLENEVGSDICPEIQTEIRNIKTESENQTNNNMTPRTELTADLFEKDNENLFEMHILSKTVGTEIKCNSKTPEKEQDGDTFSIFVANQHKLFLSLESVDSMPIDSIVSSVASNDIQSEQTKKDNFQPDSMTNHSKNEENIIESNMEIDDIHKPDVPQSVEPNPDTILALNQTSDIENSKPQSNYVMAELSNNAYIFLTFPKHLPTSLGQPAIELKAIENTKVKEQDLGQSAIELKEIENTKDKPQDLGDKVLVKKKNKEHLAVTGGSKKDIDRNSLRAMLLKSLFKRDGGDRSVAGHSQEVDAAVPFSCISSPEVVATPTASAQDNKPRSVMSSALNGLPLPRAADDYKKSLDENGNAVQGNGSPVSGSNQHKKPRRKKSSKNETVIKSHQIDGYQGNKDLNEVLRFIESNADVGRGAKLRGKHKDDDDKNKKRHERRKQDKGKRASSLEELSRTTLEDLTDRAEPAPAKPERRSWGDERDFPDAAAEHDFQTVTKRRKPRRSRADPPRPAPRRDSAPPSDRSHDSNDDQDSVRSLPAAARAPAPAAASYADIARARLTVPDLIESCSLRPPRQPRRRPRAPAAPDVLADRPPVVLRDERSRPDDMAGVTFGFDVNEQLLRGVPVAACRPLRYLPPDPPPPTDMLAIIVDYVGTAWEEVIRGAGKVRYFSE